MLAGPGWNRDPEGAHRTPCARRADSWGVCWCLLPAAACLFVYLSVLPVTDLWGGSRSANFFARPPEYRTPCGAPCGCPPLGIGIGELKNILQLLYPRQWARVGPSVSPWACTSSSKQPATSYQLPAPFFKKKKPGRKVCIKAEATFGAEYPLRHATWPHAAMDNRWAPNELTKGALHIRDPLTTTQVGV